MQCSSTVILILMSAKRWENVWNILKQVVLKRGADVRGARRLELKQTFGQHIKRYAKFGAGVRGSVASKRPTADLLKEKWKRDNPLESPARPMEDCSNLWDECAFLSSISQWKNFGSSPVELEVLGNAQTCTKIAGALHLLVWKVPRNCHFENHRFWYPFSCVVEVLICGGICAKFLAAVFLGNWRTKICEIFRLNFATLFANPLK